MNKMMIQGLTNSNGVTAGGNKVGGGESAGGGFGEVLKDALATVNKSQNEANAMITGLASGEHANIHETMIAMEKANVTFRLAAKVQAKVLDAYKEVMRTPL